MSRNQKVTFIFLVLLAAGLWFGLGWNYLLKSWQAPLGPSMALPTQTNKPLEESTNLNDSSVPIFNITPNSFPTFLINTAEQATATSNPPLCNGPRTLTLLGIGSDTRANNYLYGLADVIRYIHIDFASPRVTVLEFPRDLWVEIPDIEMHYGITNGKLNQSYLYGNPGMGYYQGPGLGPGLLARTLELNFGARPDHYLAINMHTFVQLIDAMGGIDVYLPTPVDGRKSDQQSRNDLFFSPGSHHLNGQATLMLARIRQYSVFDRANQQNHILCGLLKAVSNPSILIKLPQIIESFSGSLQTDLSPQDISQLACLIPFMKPTDISFTTFPRTFLTESRVFDVGVQKEVFVYKADSKILQNFVKAFDLGIWPEPVQTELPKSSVSTKTPGESAFNCP